MTLSISGLILKETKHKESDRALTLLTDNGLIRAYAKAAENIKSKKFAATALFCYSDFLLYDSHDLYLVDEASVREVFFELRSDIEKLSLAQYFSELLITVTPESADTSDILKLALNTFYLLCHSEKPCALIKAVFELRLMSLIGFLPNLVGCEQCGKFESDEAMFFDLNSAQLLCADCNPAGGRSGRLPLDMAALNAMRHIVYSEPKNIFSFKASSKTLSQLSAVTEKYVEAHLDRSFKTLHFYHSVRTTL